MSDIIVKRLTRCAYEECRKPLEIGLSKGSKRRYCSDAHRKYAWKKRHWTQYLSWQRDYVRRKQYLPTGGMNADAVLANNAGKLNVAGSTAQ